MDEKETGRLVEAALKARRFAKAKYSNFHVGTAILTTDNQIFSGCNVESSSYSLSICAERIALTKALSEGKTDFKAIAIAGRDGVFCPPCGACRQMLYDYAPDLIVILSDGRRTRVIA
ncbi:MAG TPA: cytidine deaminase [Caldithrix sp.]|nr:cytidine deaminase [Caldithrix sp.]